MSDARLLAILPSTAKFPRIMMRKRACLVLALAIVATTTSRAQVGGVTHVDTVAAPSLHRNLLGDPDRREVTVYLPPSYSKRQAKRYPVVYLLHGFAADHRAFMRGAYQNLNVRISMDSLIRSGAVGEMIVVTPSARNAFDGSFYANSIVTGNWEDFIVRDLVVHIDQKYRTVRTRLGRGIAGHSMGGFGALRIGMRHPETFSAIYALSPCCLGNASGPEGLGIRSWKTAIGLTERSQFAKAGFIPNIIYALAAMYSPNAAKLPFFVDLPYRIEGDSLSVVPDVAARWMTAPLSEVGHYAVSLKRMNIAFDAGRADGFRDIPINVQKLDSALSSLGVEHSAELYDGTHGNRIRSRLDTKVFPFFSGVLR